MTEKKRPRVIILKSDRTALKKTESVLTRAGWDVRSETTSKSALQTVAEAKKNPFALFITDSKLPKMEGDEILKQVKHLSPFTQRMIMLPTNNPDILISAINKAKVNACITRPFKDEDLIFLSKNCFKKFRHAVKKEQLKRVTRHQNKQLYKAAQKLKKKDDGYKNQIEDKKARVLQLKSKARKLLRQHQLVSGIGLNDYIDKNEIPASPEAFREAFLSLCRGIEKKFTRLSADLDIDSGIFNLESLLPIDQSHAIVDDMDSEPDETDSQEPPTFQLSKEILKTALTGTLKNQDPRPEPPSDATDAIVLDESEPDITESDEDRHTLDAHYTLEISKDQTEAVLQKKSPDQSGALDHSSDDILDLLRHHQVDYGIVDDNVIDTWLENPSIKKMTIAKGDPPDPGKDGKVTYLFETEFTNPGKINEDGSIDFRDRGETPFVEKGTVVAQKEPAREARPGMSVFALPILVDEVFDPPFEPGPGTELSEDGLSLIAGIDGQPHLDKMGTVSVSAELVIPGDVDFETGNITFNGNIIVKGLIKEGFRVKGINLTAQEIEGGIIDVTGSVHISAGITESKIKAQGNVYAKFVNKSDIMAFGNLHVSKEILNSNIHLSGQCINTTGQILASRITSKMGVEAGQIGTVGSGPSTFKIGIDEHVEILMNGLNEKLEASVSKAKIIKDQIKAFEDEDMALYQQVSENAHIQDRAQLDIKEMLKELKALEEVNDMAQTPLIKDEIKKNKEKAKAAEANLNTIFEKQDALAEKIQGLKKQLGVLETENKTLVREKKMLKNFGNRTKPVSKLSVSGTIISGNVVKGPHSQLILNEDKSRCTIQEIGSKESGVDIFDMHIIDL